MVWLFRQRLIQQEESNRQLISSAFYVFLLYGFSTHHMILERFSIYLFLYAMLLLPKLVVSFAPQNRRSKGVVIAAVLVVLFGFSYLMFASQQGTNGFHKVYPYVGIWDNRG